MCIGNAINAFQEARWLSFTPIKWMLNNNFFHVQASEQYMLSVLVFLAATGLIFLKQFYKSLHLSVLYFINLGKNTRSQTSAAG